MSINEIKVGQKWKTYLGRVVTIDRMTEKGFLVIDEAGSTYEVNERGQSDSTGFLAVDLESLVAGIESIFPNISELGTAAGRVSMRKFTAEPAQPVDHVELTLRGADVQLDGMHVTFAGDDTVDADELASETLSALGWVFDGQCWLQPEQANWATAPKSALDVQQGGSHYKKLRIQPVEYIHANEIPFEEGSVIKYVTRWRDKGGVKDLEKAKHFIELLIELEAKYPRGA